MISLTCFFFLDRHMYDMLLWVLINYILCALLVKTEKWKMRRKIFFEWVNEYHLHFLIDSNDEYLFWFLLQPITFTFVYVGTTLKDLSDVTHGWAEVSKTRWVSAMPPIVVVISVVVVWLQSQKAKPGPNGIIPTC